MSESADMRNRRIRAAGVLQAVITSGVPMRQWVSRSMYGLRVVNYLAARLGGAKLDKPKIPYQAEKDNGDQDQAD